jgi:predicted nucleic acid-binding Zn ribbon protein
MIALEEELNEEPVWQFVPNGHNHCPWCSEKIKKQNITCVECRWLEHALNKYQRGR